MKNFLLFFILLTSFSGRAQFSTPPNNYRSPSNPHYWKNKLPFEGYWQQDVHYTINARIDDSTDIIHADEYKLVYWNNSPFDLNELYFHLYQNAFQPGSHYHDLNIQNKLEVKFGKYEQQGLGTVIDSLRVNGEVVKTSLDNTVLKVILNKPLKSGESLTVTCKFKTYFDDGSMRRRMDMFNTAGYKHYNGVHWYPTICVYDRKFTWHTDQHLDKEFYNNFGTFDIRLTFPQEYIVEATGNLVNQSEVMPDSLRQKLDISNFKKRPADGKPSVIIPREYGKTKTWIYHAENVHNFAFTANPTYRIGEVVWKGVRCISLAQELNAYGWQQSALFTAQVIKTYSEDLGMYDWPKIIVADANDGMEYPMITLDAGSYPSHQGLLAHEVGHMWFYGMLASNETYRAFMDEGFTQFLTVWSMDKIVGEKRQRLSAKKFITKHLDSSDTRYERLYYPYVTYTVSGYDDFLNTHSAGFHGAIRQGGNYGLVYFKAGTMLYNLRYVLGDTLFQNAMRHYVQKWKFAHPYPEDFRDAITEYVQTDLNWFFDQWLETTKHIDYSIEKVKNLGDNHIGYDKEDAVGKELGFSFRKNYYRLSFKRIGRMEMPLDFVVTSESGKKYKYHIPNRDFIKTLDSGTTILPKWYGWDLLHPTYTADIYLPKDEKIKSVEIDPEHYLADIDLTNNKKGNGGIRTWEFDHRVPNLTSWTKQKNFWRPDIWYNHYDGIQTGLHIEGKYLSKYSYSASAWYNTRLAQYRLTGEPEKGNQPFAFNIYNENSTSKFWPKSKVYEQAYYNAGIWKGELGLEKIFRKQDQQNQRYSKIFIRTKYLVNDLSFRNYLMYPNQWGPTDINANNFININSKNHINSNIDIGYFRNYVYTAGTGEFTLTGRVPSIGSDYNYGYLNLNSINKINYKNFEIKSRVFGQWGVGDLPFESSLYLAGANPEALIDNKYTMARAFVPTDWLGYNRDVNHFQYGGGLNLRGYAGYLAPQETKIHGKDTLYFTYFGKSGAAYNLEIDFDKFIKIPAKGLTKNLKLDTYLFTDMGIMGYKTIDGNRFGKFRMDAGIGTALTIKFSPYDIKPLTLRFDMPLFLNTPPAVSDYFAFRCVVSVNRAF